MNEVGKEFTRVEITCHLDEVKTTGYALRRDLDKGERIAKALKILGVLWLVAFFTVFVPILHFVLVPLFLLLGVIFAVTTWLERGEVLKGEITCPNCGKKIEWGREAEDWPKTQRCPGCSFTLTFNKTSEGQANSALNQGR